MANEVKASDLHSGHVLIEGSNRIRVAQMIAQKHALRLEVLGMSHSRGSIYAAVKRQHNLKGNKKKVLEQLTELIEREMDHWYDVLVHGKPAMTLMGRYEDVKACAEQELGSPNFTLSRRKADDEFAAELVERARLEKGSK